MQPIICRRISYLSAGQMHMISISYFLFCSPWFACCLLLIRMWQINNNIVYQACCPVPRLKVLLGQAENGSFLCGVCYFYPFFLFILFWVWSPFHSIVRTIRGMRSQRISLPIMVPIWRERCSLIYLSTVRTYIIFFFYVYWLCLRADCRAGISSFLFISKIEFWCLHSLFAQ